jgi:hypothetical protein
MPDRFDTGDDISTGATNYHVSFTPPFQVVPNVSITAQNMSSGDYYSLTNKTNSGFDIAFRNSAGDLISRTFDWQAKGY